MRRLALMCLLSDWILTGSARDVYAHSADMGDEAKLIGTPMARPEPERTTNTCRKEDTWVWGES
jgi:hypothetical protein